MEERGDRTVTIAPRDAIVRLVQVTDTHLRGEPGGTLLGMDTDDSLRAVLALLDHEQPAFDALLATGDLSDNAAGSAYARLSGYLDALTDRHYWLPGNHDDRDVMSAVVGAARMPEELRLGGWQIVLLDSQVPGEVGGELGDRELARLDRALARASDAGLFSLLCLHHQPVPIGCAWLDQQMVADADALFAIVDAYPGVRGVLWGHVHQTVDRLRGDVRLLCSPSTCVQFKPGQPSFALDDAAPGYRWLTLYPDGRLESGVSRANGAGQDVDLESTGYL
jgi:Icc protein